MDVSNYTGNLTAGQITAWKEAGIKRVIVRASIESEIKKAIARQQCEMVAQEGLELHVYGWPYLYEPLAVQIKAHCDLVYGLPVKRYWLDLEDNAVIWDATQMVAKIREAVEAATLPMGLYTTAFWWQRWTGNSAEFASLPLYYAHYDGDPTFADYVPFGGWVEPAMKQFTDSGEFGDMNVFWD